MTDDRQEALERALQAAVRAKNPWLARSIRAAMNGESYDPFEDLCDGMHPEIREVWDGLHSS